MGDNQPMEHAAATAHLLASAQPANDESSGSADASHSDAVSLIRSSAAWWSEAARSLPGVSQSCLRLAALRAEETSRTDLAPGQSPLVSDPFAGALAGHRRPERAHHVFRQTNRQQVREAAMKTHGATAAAAAGAQAHSPNPIAAESTNAVADAIPPPVEAPSAAAAASASASPAPSRAALRAELQSQASLQNQERDQAPDTMIRTRFIDDTVAELASDSGSGVSRPLEQMVLLGAGLDSRAYRLECLSRTVVFELDVAPVLHYKTAVFSALGVRPLAKGLHRVAVDFALCGGKPRVSKTSQRAAKRARYEPEASATAVTAAGASGADSVSHADSQQPQQQQAHESDEQQPPWLTSLLSAGFDPTRRTLWVAEGLLMYLGVRQVANLLGWAAAATRVSTTGAGAAATASSPQSSPCPSSSSSPAPAPAPLHYFVADVVNEEMARSRLKWFRFFRWGCSRLPPQLAPLPPSTDKKQEREEEEASGTTASGAAAAPTPIEQFMRANGWQICTRADGGESYGAASTASGSAASSGSAAAASSSSSPPPPLPARYRVTPAGTILAEDNTFQQASIYQQCLLLAYQLGDEDAAATGAATAPASPGLCVHLSAGPRLRRLLYGRVVQLLSPSLRADSPELVGSGPPSADLDSERRHALRAYLRVLRRLESETELRRAANGDHFDYDFGIELSQGYISVPGNQASDAAMATALAATQLTDPVRPARLAELERQLQAAFAWESDSDSDSARREAASANDAVACDESATRESVLDVRASFGVDDELQSPRRPMPAPSSPLGARQAEQSSPITATQFGPHFSPPSLPPAPAHLHIHPIGRDALSYGRYLHPPTVDSTSHPRKPPMILETYMIRAQVMGAQE